MPQQPSRSIRLAILSYHEIGAPPRGVWEPWFYVPEEVLIDHLSVLEKEGWEIIDLRSALSGLSRPKSLPERSALLTFDDGFLSVLERALPILSERALPAVMFVPTASIGRRRRVNEETGEPLEPICGWKELREVEAGGISVESHGTRHIRFSELEPREIANELHVSNRLLESGLGKNVQAFAFPYGDGGNSSEHVSRALNASGYTAAFLYGGGPITPGVDDPYRLSRLAIGPDSDLAGMLEGSV